MLPCIIAGGNNRFGGSRGCLVGKLTVINGVAVAILEGDVEIYGVNHADDFQLLHNIFFVYYLTEGGENCD